MTRRKDDNREANPLKAQIIADAHGGSEDVAAYDAALARDEESFSAEVADRLIAGDTPLKVFRKHRGLTQRQLADKADTAAAYVSQIETGRRAGSIAMLRRLAHALDLEIDDLI